MNITITYLKIIIEIFKFLRKSFVKSSTLIATIICLLFLNMIKSIASLGESNNEGNLTYLLLFSSGIIFALNCFIIYIIERKGFIEIIRLRKSDKI